MQHKVPSEGYIANSSSSSSTEPGKGAADIAGLSTTPLDDPCSSAKFVGGIAELWALPLRREPLVVVVCGR